jgi:hypothetical protein
VHNQVPRHEAVSRAKQHAMKTYVGVMVYFHAFLTLALDHSALLPGRFTSAEGSPGTHWVGDWWAPDSVWMRWWKEKNPCFSRKSTPVFQPVVSSLYWLSYPGCPSEMNFIYLCVCVCVCVCVWVWVCVLHSVRALIGNLLNQTMLKENGNLLTDGLTNKQSDWPTYFVRN